MNIKCNGQTHEVESNISLYAFLVLQEMEQKKGIAVAVNNNIIKRDSWKNHTLGQNDTVLIISATKGG